MPQKQIATKSFQKLIDWYQKNQRDFLWRRNPQPYWVWLAEVMSQQTQMTTLVRYFHRFITRFPTIADLAQASEHDVLKLWAGLGYYSRARNLKKTADIIYANYLLKHKTWPTEYEQWLALPGIGEYTAAAIVAQCFNKKVAVWDGNVLRVMARLTNTPAAHTKEFKLQSLQQLNQFIQHYDPSLFNQAMMELGATICSKNQPSCSVCPLNKNCLSYINKTVKMVPAKKIRAQSIQINAKVLIEYRVNKSNKIEFLLYQRSKPNWFAGLWDFNSELGGEKHKTIELIDRQKIKSSQQSVIVRHHITKHKIELRGYVTKISQTPKTPGLTQWVELDDLLDQNQSTVALATTAHKILKEILKNKNVIGESNV